MTLFAEHDLKTVVKQQNDESDVGSGKFCNYGNMHAFLVRTVIHKSPGRTSGWHLGVVVLWDFTACNVVYFLSSFIPGLGGSDDIRGDVTTPIKGPGSVDQISKVSFPTTNARGIYPDSNSGSKVHHLLLR